MTAKILPWIRKNSVLLVMIVLVVILFRVGNNQHWGYKQDIDALNDSINDYIEDIRGYQARETVAEEKIQAYELRLDDYVASRELEREERINEKYEHAKEIADLKRIPVDTLYVDVAGWLDSLSVLWGTD